jgi:[ribosomal protein S18]-alanine N-acetyltransferase
MITDSPVTLATSADAAAIAAMSRDLIESGLGWSWTEGRVRRVLQDPETNVAVIRDRKGILAFGIMSYRDEAAHLVLFAVRRSHRRKGLGSLVLRWLEDVARTAGLARIQVECRRDNPAARNFYGEHGYHELVISKGYYSGVEDAVRLEKRLGAE